MTCDLRHVALCAVAFLAIGCPPPAEPPKEPICTADKKCTGGQVCELATDPTKNACVPCRKDNECERDEFCHPLERRCKVRPCFGHECQVHDDCVLGKFCVQGVCLSADKPTAEGCAVVSCADGEVCNEGQRCHTANKVCEDDLGCSADAECGVGERCNTATGRCDLACTRENSTQVCGVARVCDSGTCVDCVTDDDCGGGLKCNKERRTCESLTSCLNDRDCEIPLVCNRLTKECTTTVPPCLSAEDCALGETCQLATGKCVPAACVLDRFEPDNTLAGARVLPIGNSPNLSLCTGDVDYFKVALGEGDRLQAVIDVDPLLNFDVAIVTGANELLAQGEFAVEAIADVAGDYYVRAQSVDPYVRYGLRTSVSRGVPCRRDDNEPNDAFTTATTTGAGEFFQKSLCPRDFDWYAVSVTRGQTIEVELASTPTDGDLDLAIYDSDGTRVLARSATTAEVESASTAAFAGSRVYVRVSGASAATQNVYDLFIRLRGG